MWPHLRANLWLLGLTLLLCSVAYPLALLGVGQGLFRHEAQGSLVDVDGRPARNESQAVGSLLIAQPFHGDEFFHPRPSAVNYTADSSGASNYGASNPELRKRVLWSLGPIIKFRDGRTVGPEIVKWFRDQLSRDPDVVARWAQQDDGLAEHWEESDKSDREIQSLFFERWWKAHPDAEFDPVPADLVMTSGSGLDPDITLKAALYQLDRVAVAWAKKTGRDQDRVRADVEELLRHNAGAPLAGLAGDETVNVLEVNLALRALMNERANP